MTRYVLTYFKFRARCEVIRWLFALGDTPYTEINVERDKRWPELKPKTPFGNIPILEFDGKVLSQSHAIERFLAKKLDLVGKSEWDQARVEMIIGCLEDSRGPALNIRRELDPVRKAQMREKYEKELLPFYLKKFNELLPEGDTYFVGNEMTWADLVFTVFKDVPNEIAGVPMDWSSQPRLKAIIDAVESHPKIAKRIATRPFMDH